MDGKGDIKNLIMALDAFIPNPSAGLPEEVFLFISRLTPMVNVDLLIRDERGRTLLTWRDDGYCAAGWHVPGGIIRFKEKFADRIRVVARTELGAEVAFDRNPMAINEFIIPDRAERSHFISFLHECFLLSSPDESRAFQSGAPLPGQWMWHGRCPENIIAAHKIYKEFM